MMQFTRIVARNSAWGLAAQFGIKILSFSFSVLVLRRLGAEEYGQYSAVLAFGAMFVFLGDLGISPYLVRQIARSRNSDDGRAHAQHLFGNALVLRLLLSCIAAVLM